MRAVLPLRWTQQIISTSVRTFCSEVFRWVFVAFFMRLSFGIRRNYWNSLIVSQKPLKKVSKKFRILRNWLSSYTCLLFVSVGLEHSNSHKLYTKTGQILEKCIEFLDIAVLKVTPIAAVWPATIVSFFTYFTTDLGNAAFELPVPIW